MCQLISVQCTHRLHMHVLVDLIHYHSHALSYNTQTVYKEKYLCQLMCVYSIYAVKTVGLRYTAYFSHDSST